MDFSTVERSDQFLDALGTLRGVVLESDDVDALSARILEQEHICYSEAIATVLSGDCVIEGRCVKVKS